MEFNMTYTIMSSKNLEYNEIVSMSRRVSRFYSTISLR